MEVDSAPDNIYDVFIIGTDVYMVYFSSVYSVETGDIIRSGLGATNDWSLDGPGATHLNALGTPSDARMIYSHTNDQLSIYAMMYI